MAPSFTIRDVSKQAEQAFFVLNIFYHHHEERGGEGIYQDCTPSLALFSSQSPLSLPLHRPRKIPSLTSSAIKVLPFLPLRTRHFRLTSLRPRPHLTTPQSAPSSSTFFFGAKPATSSVPNLPLVQTVCSDAWVLHLHHLVQRQLAVLHLVQ